LYVQGIDAGLIPGFVTAIQSGHLSTQHAATWGIFHMAMHGSDIADQLAKNGVLPPLLAVYCSGTTELQALAKSALKEVTRHCTVAGPLLALVHEKVSVEIVSHVLQQGLRIMQGSVAGRREFVTTGALMILQQLEPTLDEKGQACVQAINNLFPQDVVSYYRHGVQALAR
jgi:hypothetical protein